MKQFILSLIFIFILSGTAFSAQYQGDIAEDATITFRWNTSGANGASITRGTNGTVKVIRDDGTDCTGTSVTDTEDSPDTGIHLCQIDTNDNANYTTGHDYTVWLDGATIDSQVVNAALAEFSIENRFTNVSKYGGNAVTATVSGIPDVNVTYWEDSAVSDSDGTPDVNQITVKGTDSDSYYLTREDLVGEDTSMQAMTGHVPADCELIEGADATDTIRNSVWNASASALTTVGSIGLKLASYLNIYGY